MASVTYRRAASVGIVFSRSEGVGSSSSPNNTVKQLDDVPRYPQPIARVWWMRKGRAASSQPSVFP